jgi:hypothetical protein
LSNAEARNGDGMNIPRNRIRARKDLSAQSFASHFPICGYGLHRIAMRRILFSVEKKAHRG